jgi:hypothetical protein
MDWRQKKISAEELSPGTQPCCPSRDDFAPVFTAEAFVNNQIVTINLQQLLGKWVILFFYTGNFTFV